MPPNELVQIVNLLLNAGGLVVLLGVLLTGFVMTRAAVETIIKGKDERIADLKERNSILQAKVNDLTLALSDSVDANKRLADIWEDRIRRRKGT